MNEMSSVEKSKLPYSLLLDPLTNRAAAYTNTHGLITPDASAQLVAFALANQSRQVPWDESLHDTAGRWRPLPAWATVDVRKRCVLVWIKRGHASDAYFASIPKR
jgi:hypothetical protein